MEKYYEFKASTVENAVKNGLAELGLTEEEAAIEVVSNGGIFSRAVVRITPKVQEETLSEDEYAVEETEEAVVAETDEEYAEATEDEVIPQKEETEEEREEKFVKLKELRDAGKEYIRKIAEFTGADITVDGKVKEEEICLYIGGEDARNFIGHKGETLEAVQVLVNNYLNKFEEGEKTRIVVDADFYRERRKRTLTALAKKLARQAYNQHKEIALEPMNSYERRIIHSALTGSDDATTRSDGEGKYRHVVIVPKSGTMSYGNASSDFRRKGPQKTKSFGYNKKRF